MAKLAKLTGDVEGSALTRIQQRVETFRRIASEELGRADLLGVYEHACDDNFGGQPGIATHDVVLGYKLRGTIELASLPDLRHTAYRWATVSDTFSRHRAEVAFQYDMGTLVERRHHYFAKCANTLAEGLACACALWNIQTLSCPLTSKAG